MLDELRDLYQDVILDHGRNPRNFHQPEACNRVAHGNNPMCGDLLVVYLAVDEAGVIQEAAFQGKGCAISVASASMMTEIVKGKTVQEAEHIFENFHDMCTQDGWDRDPAEFEDPDAMERLHVLSGVREFPVRVKCATLAWHTMSAAMAGEAEISTE
jgi:nitrogen fixation NifU-like protein